MAKKAKKQKKHKKGGKNNAQESGHVIQPAIPIDALSNLVIDPDEKTPGDIAAYVEGQSPRERVTHAEKLMTQHVFGRKHECWDVRTNKSRLWVITSPTNLYDQKLFPSLDYTLSFHIGIAARLASQHEPDAGILEQMMMPEAWRKWEQAGQALNDAQEPEDFQTVGMRCRECLIALVQALKSLEMVPAGGEAPQNANVIAWCELIANHVARGASADAVRGYLKAVSKTGWALVSWLTHARDATRADGIMAHKATEHILILFASAAMRYRQGVPDRCEKCGSYQFELWADEPGVPMRARCRACGWMKEAD